MKLRSEMFLGSVGVLMAMAVSCASNDVSPGGTVDGTTGATGSGSGVNGSGTGSGSGAGGSGQGFGANGSSTTGGTVTVTEVMLESENAANCPATQPAEGSACMILNDCAYDATGDLCVCTAQTWACSTQQTESEDDNPFGGMFGGDGGGDGGTDGMGGNGGASTTGETTTDGGAGAPPDPDPDAEPECPAAAPTNGDACSAALECPFGDVTCSCRGENDTWFCAPPAD